MTNKLAFLALNAILAMLVSLGLLLFAGATQLGMGGGNPALVAVVVACGLFVGGAGLALLYRTHFSARVAEAREAQIRKRYPDQPWMLNPDWAKGRIIDFQVGRVIFGFVFIAGWLGGIAFIGVVNFEKILSALKTSPPAWAAAAFFVLITASAMNIVIKVTGSWLSIGNGILRLETLPGFVGGQFKAKLETRALRRPKAGLQLDLTCVHHLGRSFDRHPKVDAETVWRQSSNITARQMRILKRRLVIPIVVDVEDGLLPSGPTGQGGFIEWKLRVSSVSPVDKFMLFEWAVPIYRKGRDARRLSAQMDVQSET